MAEKVKKDWQQFKRDLVKHFVEQKGGIIRSRVLDRSFLVRNARLATFAERGLTMDEKWTKTKKEESRENITPTVKQRSYVRKLH